MIISDSSCKFSDHHSRESTKIQSPTGRQNHHAAGKNQPPPNETSSLSLTVHLQDPLDRSNSPNKLQHRISTACRRKSLLLADRQLLQRDKLITCQGPRVTRAGAILIATRKKSRSDRVAGSRRNSLTLKIARLYPFSRLYEEYQPGQDMFQRTIRRIPSTLV